MLRGAAQRADLPPACHPDDRDPALAHRPLYLTSGQSPLGGAIKQRPEDFLVEEIPLYQPCGAGEHIYLFMEKRELTTSDLVRFVARHFHVAPRAVGVAGQKDKHAVTRQVVSIHTPGRSLDDFTMLEHPQVRVLWADMHTNKLRTGHLAGNRFSIKIRGIDMTGVLGARKVFDHLSRQGVPNFAGPQRFGIRQDGHILGCLLFLGNHERLLDQLLAPDPHKPELHAVARDLYAQGEFDAAIDAFPRSCRAERMALVSLARGDTPQRAIRRIDRDLRRLWMTAFQSALFNRVLANRLESGTFDLLEIGDVAYKHDNGSLFQVDRAVRDDPATTRRLETFEISPSGPLWGHKMLRAGADVARREDDVLASAGVDGPALASARERTGIGMEGDRRPLRVPLRDPEVEGGIDEHGHYVRCAFELPKGAFATAVMREVLKDAGPCHASGEETGQNQSP